MALALLFAILPGGLVHAAGTAGESESAGINLFTNPHLDTGVAGWDTQPKWDPGLDAGGNPHSGSLLLSVSASSGRCINATQCIVVTPGTYELSGKILVPDSTYPAGSAALMEVIWAERADCIWAKSAGAGTASTPYVYLDSTTHDRWQRITTGPAVAPPETHSALIYLTVCASPSETRPSTVTANFDDLVFARTRPETEPAAEP